VASPEAVAQGPGAEQHLALADDLSVAFLLLLERLGPEEREALRPIRGAAKVARLFLGISRRVDPGTLQIRQCLINGAPGFVPRTGDGELLGTFAFEVSADAIERIYVVRNPDKLQRVDAGEPIRP
jgi:hypothetical protein